MKYSIKYHTNNKWKEEGIYQTKLIANKHMRKLKRKYVGTQFKIIELLGT